MLTSWHSYIHITSLIKSIKPSGVAYSAQDTLNPPTRPRVSASQSGDPQRSADSTETDPIQADHCNRIGQQAAQGSWQKATVIQRQTDRSHRSYLAQTISSARYIRNRHTYRCSHPEPSTRFKSGSSHYTRLSVANTTQPCQASQ